MSNSNSKLKMVVLDGYALNPGDLSWDKLQKYGDLRVYERTSPDQTLEHLGDAVVAFTNKVRLDKSTLTAASNLKYIGVLATGVDVVDLHAARDLGIVVTNVPTYSTKSVSQFVFALLLEICHHVQRHSDAVHNGKWTSSGEWTFWDFPLIELSGKTMGIIGFGRIGQATGKLAQCFGMNVLAYDQSRNANLETERLRYTDLKSLLQESDVIVLHCPLTPETRGIINRKTIASMKEGVILINNSRGQLVNDHDLAEALNAGKVYAAGLDVISSEPIQPDNPLLSAHNCLITPHISWAPKESRQRLLTEVEANLSAFLTGESRNQVN